MRPEATEMSRDEEVEHTHSLHIQSRRLHEGNAKIVSNEGGDAKGYAVLT